jgi:hypothetical protein
VVFACSSLVVLVDPAAALRTREATTVDQGVAASVVVSLGYADSATGLTPWLGSPNTIFLGEPPQCCATHGPDNGGNGYDGGAIEIANQGASAVTVDSLSVDFGGGSSPSAFDLWSDSTTQLPRLLAPGERLVLTATSSFDFDTSDLFGEACHINSGVVPVVHVSVDGSITDYEDDHQILNSDGADLASCPGAISEQVPFQSVIPGSQPDALAVNDVLPSVTVAGPANSRRIPMVGRIVSGFAGGWTASPPPTLSLQWDRCNTGGAACNPISGATRPTYIPTSADVDRTLRLRVAAANGSGRVATLSAPTSVVRAGPPVAQLGHTVTGFTSTFVDSPNELSWPERATASGITNDFAFFARGAGNDQVFTPKIYRTANGQASTLLATGASVIVPRGTDGQWYVSDLSGARLVAGTDYVFALDPSGSFNGTYVGGEPDGETSFFVDYAPTSSGSSGYWMLDAAGHVYSFGDALNFGSSAGSAVAIAARRDGNGYWTTDAFGDVHGFGAAHADAGRPRLRAGELIATISGTPSGNGYWLFTNQGRAIGHGDARFVGDLRNVHLNGPIVSSVATPTGRGYYMVGSDGGVFSFGDAAFHGSTGNKHLNRPVVGLSPTPGNNGYWLVASDGGVFAFGAPFRGSLGAVRLNRPVNGIIAFGNGYLMVASDGGVFDFSNKAFVGSLGSHPPAATVIGIATATS